MSPEIAVRRAAPEDARAIAEVRVESWRTTYRGMIPQAYLDAMSVEGSAAMWHRILTAGSDKTSIFVAAEGASVIGFASGNLLAAPKHGFDAELTAIYLRAGAQRRGIGRRLVAAVAKAERDQGATGLLVWVIAANRAARAFYEALGAELIVEQPFEWDGMDLCEAGFAWRDFDALLAACRADTVSSC